MKQAMDNPVIVETIRNAGGRATSARVRILALIRAISFPLSHSEIETLLAQDAQPVDRVTIYRVLDWLADVGLAHKAADGSGVFHFSVTNPDSKHAQHIHLRCTGCGGMFCLDTPLPPLPVLPRGFRFSGMSLDIRGKCPRCVRSST
ncbi:MAG: Fur family transcriptional regulator [Gallionellaceae bacterium]